MLGHGGSSAGSYLADPTSPIPSHCAVITLFQSVSVHQLSRLALQELNVDKHRCFTLFLKDALRDLKCIWPNYLSNLLF